MGCSDKIIIVGYKTYFVRKYKGVTIKLVSSSTAMLHWHVPILVRLLVLPDLIEEREHVMSVPYRLSMTFNGPYVYVVSLHLSTSAFGWDILIWKRSRVSQQIYFAGEAPHLSVP